MRQINARQITGAVKRLCIVANCHLPQNMKNRNQKSLRTKDQPICQDTGVTCVFWKNGQEVHICGDNQEVINAGIWQGDTQGVIW